MCCVIGNQLGKVVLVGYLWGGMVIIEVGVDSKVVGFVYVVVFVLDVGQLMEEVGKDYVFVLGIGKFVVDVNGYLLLFVEVLVSDFVQDVFVVQVCVMVVM